MTGESVAPPSLRHFDGGGNDEEEASGGAGGGGGSGLGPAGATSEDGVRDGDGEVVFTYDPELPACGAAAPIVVEPRFTG